MKKNIEQNLRTLAYPKKDMTEAQINKIEDELHTLIEEVADEILGTDKPEWNHELDEPKIMRDLNKRKVLANQMDMFTGNYNRFHVGENDEKTIHRKFMHNRVHLMASLAKDILGIQPIKEYVWKAPKLR